MNPFVNPGAIATVGNIKGSPDEVWNKIIQFHSDFAGRQLEVNHPSTNPRAIPISATVRSSMLMSAYREFPMDPGAAVDLYTRACSINVSAHDLAVMGATLAYGGRNPVTGKQAIEASHVPGLLAIMSTAGMYDDSGRWLYRTGLPTKSGVGGGLIAVSPGKVRDRYVRAAARWGGQQRAWTEGDCDIASRVEFILTHSSAELRRRAQGCAPHCVPGCALHSLSPQAAEQPGHGEGAYLFDDAHFHLTNYIQKGLTAKQYVAMMGDCREALHIVRNPAPANMELRQFRRLRANLLSPN